MRDDFWFFGVPNAKNLAFSTLNANALRVFYFFRIVFMFHAFGKIWPHEVVKHQAQPLFL